MTGSDPRRHGHEMSPAEVKALTSGKRESEHWPGKVCMVCGRDDCPHLTASDDEPPSEPPC